MCVAVSGWCRAGDVSSTVDSRARVYLTERRGCLPPPSIGSSFRVRKEIEGRCRDASDRHAVMQRVPEEQRRGTACIVGGEGSAAEEQSDGIGVPEQRGTKTSCTGARLLIGDARRLSRSALRLLASIYKQQQHALAIFNAGTTAPPVSPVAHATRGRLPFRSFKSPHLSARTDRPWLLFLRGGVENTRARLIPRCSLGARGAAGA